MCAQDTHTGNRPLYENIPGLGDQLVSRYSLRPTTGRAPQVMILIDSVVCFYNVQSNVLVIYVGYHISVQFSLRPAMNRAYVAAFVSSS